jgi:hypothetical protein
VEDVLIESGEEENLVALIGPPMVPPTCCWRLCGLNARKGSAAPKELSRK